MFALTADHLAVRDMAKSFADERLAPNALHWDETEHFPADVLREAAALGMAAIYVGEQHGGSGMTRLDAALIFEALSTGCPCIASFLSIHNMVAWVIDGFGSPELKSALSAAPRRRWSLIASYCLTEPGSGSDAAALTTRARRDGDDYVLDGVKQFISGAGVSDLYLVMARTGEGGAVRSLRLPGREGRAGLKLRREREEDGMARAADPSGDHGGRARSGRQSGRRRRDRLQELRWLGSTAGGSTSAPARSAAGNRRSTRRSPTCASARRSAGASPTSRRCNSVSPTLRLRSRRRARCCGARRARLDEKSPEATRLCAMAKQIATDTGFNAANDALQLFGGYGYLADYGVEKIVRDLRVHQILEGTNEIMRVIVARGLIEN